jgi:hypothetical protein
MINTFIPVTCHFSSQYNPPVSQPFPQLSSGAIFHLFFFGHVIVIFLISAGAQQQLSNPDQKLLKAAYKSTVSDCPVHTRLLRVFANVLTYAGCYAQ